MGLDFKKTFWKALKSMILAGLAVVIADVDSSQGVAVMLLSAILTGVYDAVKHSEWGSLLCCKDNQ